MVSVGQRLRVKEELNEPWEHYADCADTCTYSQVLKQIHSGLVGFKPTSFVLVTCAPSPPKSAIFKV